MSAIPRWMVERWQRIVADHSRPWCPVCQRRRCWEQAEARGQLIARGLPLKPPTGDRPHPTTGGARRTT